MKCLYKLVLPLFSLLAACEGQTCSSGTIVESGTGRHLDSVTITIAGFKQPWVSYTDSTGKFDICGPFGSCVPKCKDLTVDFSKPGYKTVMQTNPGDNVVIPLERE